MIKSEYLGEKNLAMDHNAKNSQDCLNCKTRAASHPINLHAYIPKLKTDNCWSIANTELRQLDE